MHYTSTQTSTLLDTLKAMAPDSSTSTLRSWLKQGRITLDGRTVHKANIAIQPGQQVALGKKQERVGESLQILYEDAHLFVVNKPSGLLTVATDYDLEHNAHTLLKERCRPGRVFPVHRLDRDTSGLLLFAKTEEARNQLKEFFASHAVQRHYLAVTMGHPKEKSGTWRSWLVDEADRVVRTASQGQGREAVTHYKMIEKSGSKALLAFTLETGRKNQIRVHCAEAGIPIFGDGKYGEVTGPRLHLHAYRLQFSHPITQKAMEFEAPLPANFQWRLKTRKLPCIKTPSGSPSSPPSP